MTLSPHGANVVVQYLLFHPDQIEQMKLDYMKKCNYDLEKFFELYYDEFDGYANHYKKDQNVDG